MVQTITATYAQDKDDWTVTVAGLDRKLSGKAPGIIAARDRADQLVEKLVPEGTRPTVVHLLNGSALEFTSAYIAARLARTEPSEEVEAEADGRRRPVAENATPAPAPKQAEPSQPQAATARTSSGRAVPRKELSKTPSPAGRSDAGTAQARYPSAAGARSGAPAGSAAVTG
ncbi:hypothetical protein SacmaDRAFT_4030 [Saccharomonospora marina XMU15]|uniref:Uncharacterized protein n=1 Tax=Saccharomonospora marina XMU15 TaxID=882083 RepID=H5X4U7_9PSEU|nr:hypothetical protein SacmaDRAFT_4030 [Saccharomonospora marina XMU15]